MTYRADTNAPLMRLPFACLLWSLAIVTPRALDAQGGVIRGDVRDVSGRAPRESIVVQLARIDTATLQVLATFGTQVDSLGGFAFFKLDPGSYVMAVQQALAIALDAPVRARRVDLTGLAVVTIHLTPWTDLELNTLICGAPPPNTRLMMGYMTGSGGAEPDSAVTVEASWDELALGGGPSGSPHGSPPGECGPWSVFGLPRP